MPGPLTTFWCRVSTLVFCSLLCPRCNLVTLVVEFSLTNNTTNILCLNKIQKVLLPSLLSLLLQSIGPDQINIHHIKIYHMDTSPLSKKFVPLSQPFLYQLSSPVCRYKVLSKIYIYFVVCPQRQANLFSNIQDSIKPINYQAAR